MFCKFQQGKKFKNGTVCGTGLADSVSEHFDVLEVIPKWPQSNPVPQTDRYSLEAGMDSLELIFQINLGHFWDSQRTPKGAQNYLK